MNESLAIETRHNTLRQYQENYESDLKSYLESYEDNSELNFLEVDLFSLKEFLKYLLTRGPKTNDIDEHLINQRKINSRNKIKTFIK